MRFRTTWMTLWLGVLHLSVEATQEEGAFHTFRQSPEPADTAVSPLPGVPEPAGPSFVPVNAGPVLQPSGALSGRIVYVSAGHGWTWGANGWSTQRGVVNQMMEDYGNLDQMTLFARLCFQAGATVVPMRPIGHQTNEVVLDNDSPGVNFNGSWAASASTVFYGSPGDLPYRFATVAATETATALYVPDIPVGGEYPVYAWAAHGGNRIRQLYRVRHTGGESLVRVPHDRVGNGWVYLGSYWFEPGANPTNGAVVISNLADGTNGTGVVVADAIRFGNGMGDVDRGGGVSTYPREEECARYWVQRSLGQGQDPAIHDGSGDDASDNVGTPPRMAAEMNREAAGGFHDRVLVSFHSNAGGGRGVVGLHNDESLFPGTSTSTNQVALARLLAKEINDDLVALSPRLETAWFDRGAALTFARSDFAFGEIRGDAIGYEMDATIVEVAFHDDEADARLMRDPKVRQWIARSACQGLIRYFNQTAAGPLVFPPEPPQNPRAIATDAGVQLTWSAAALQAGSGLVTGYVVYRSTDGRGFGDPVAKGSGFSLMLLTNVPAGETVYFRVSATNAAGESLPSEVVGCRRPLLPGTSGILFVNGFTRFDRTLNLRQTPAVRGYRPPGHDANSGTMERVLPRRVNAFDYVVAHGEALSAFGRPFDSCQRTAVDNSQIFLGNYDVVIWAAGNQSTAGRTFTLSEQSRVGTYWQLDGALLVSGSEIAWDLDRDTGPSSADRDFLHRVLHARLNGNANDDSGIYTVTPVAGGVFGGNSAVEFDDGSRGIYWVGYPDVLTPEGNGAVTVLRYEGLTTGTAGIAYDGSRGGRVVYLGFPFETIVSAADRRSVMEDALRFLSPPPRFESIAHVGPAEVELVVRGEPGIAYDIERSADFVQWSLVTKQTSVDGRLTVRDIAPSAADTWAYRAVARP